MSVCFLIIHYNVQICFIYFSVHMLYFKKFFLNIHIFRNFKIPFQINLVIKEEITMEI